MLRNLFWLFLLLGVGSQAQNNPMPRAIRHLLEYPGEIPAIYGWFRGLIPNEIIPGNLDKEMQYLIKTREHLYAGINGTGRLYHISEKEGNMVFQRLDTTFFEGYNFYSAMFTLQDTMYSYGGYGFWRTNGHLRAYNPVAREWDIQKLDQEINGTFKVSSSFWIDTADLKMYILDPYHVNEGLETDLRNIDPNAVVSVHRLDLKTNKWQLLGTTHRINKNYVQSPWGNIYIRSTSQHVLLDFKNNRRYVSGKNLNMRLKRPFFYEDNDIILYFIDSTMYIGEFNHNHLDSVAISINDFVPAGTVYASDSTWAEIPLKRAWLWGVAILVLAGGYWGVWYRRRVKDGILSQSPPAHVADHDPGSVTLTDGQPPIIKRELFSEMEKLLLQFMLEKAARKSIASVDELNKILGLTSKSEAVQKKNRNELIHNINQKWMAHSGGRQLLIDRKRSEYDKRSMEYFVEPGQVVEIRVLFGS